MPRTPARARREPDPILVGAVIAAISATALIFVAAHQNPVRRDLAARAHVPRAVINAGEERKIWSRKPADNP
jgi:hypothetical protein